MATLWYQGREIGLLDHVAAQIVGTAQGYGVAGKTGTVTAEPTNPEWTTVKLTVGAGIPLLVDFDGAPDEALVAHAARAAYRDVTNPTF